MEAIQIRAPRHDFVAFPDYENLPVIFDRVQRLLTSGRSLTLIRYFVTGEPDPRLDVAAGLRLIEHDQRSQWREDLWRLAL